MIDRISISSEIGKLKAVLVHRPGPELDNLVPRYLDNLLFDEIPWLKKAQMEHDGFVRALGRFGAEVYYIEDLAEDIIKDRKLKEELINQHLKFSTIADKEVVKIVHDYIMGLEDREAINTIIAGLPKIIVNEMISEVLFSNLTSGSYPFYLDPMPSMYFTRDHGSVINNRLLVSQMFNFSRRRETVFLRFIQKYHPMFKTAGTSLWFKEEIPTGIEGGDVIVLNSRNIIIGFSERTTEAAIETVASRLLIEENELDNIIIIQIPAKRAYMHLDTVFTMLDYDKFLMYPGIKEDIHVYRLFPGRNGHVEACSEEGLKDAIYKCINTRVDILYSGGSNPITAEREQWGDSTNTFALAPGVVVVYNRNEATNNMLIRHGIEIIEIECSELVRGRGGPRCMTMPLLRDDIQV